MRASGSRDRGDRVDEVYDETLKLINLMISLS